MKRAAVTAGIIIVLVFAAFTDFYALQDDFAALYEPYEGEASDRSDEVHKYALKTLYAKRSDIIADAIKSKADEKNVYFCGLKQEEGGEYADLDTSLLSIPGGNFAAGNSRTTEMSIAPEGIVVRTVFGCSRITNVKDGEDYIVGEFYGGWIEKCPQPVKISSAKLTYYEGGAYTTSIILDDYGITAGYEETFELDLSRMGEAQLADLERPYYYSVIAPGTRMGVKFEVQGTDDKGEPFTFETDLKEIHKKRPYITVKALKDAEMK